MSTLIQSIQAQRYWGTPISNPATGEQSPTFAKLLDVIFTCYKSAQDTPTLSGLLPATFHALTESFPFATGLECFAADAAKPTHLNERSQMILTFALTMGYYKSLSLEFSEAKTNEDGIVIPILQSAGMCQWILLHLWTSPIETAQCLSKMLKESEIPLVDTTNESFKYLFIPKECLPKIHEDAVPNMQKYQRDWLMTRSNILSTAKVDLTLEERDAVHESMMRIAETNQQRARDTAQNTQRMAMASAQASLAAYNSLNVGGIL